MSGILAARAASRMVRSGSAVTLRPSMVSEVMRGRLIGVSCPATHAVPGFLGHGAASLTSSGGGVSYPCRGRRVRYNVRGSRGHSPLGGVCNMNLLRRNHVSHRAAALLAGTLGLVVLAVPACNNEEGTTGVRSAQIFAGTVSGDNATLSGSVVLNLTGTSVTGEITVVAPDDAAGTRVLTGLFGSDKKLTASDGTVSGYKFSGTYDGTSRLDGTLRGPVISTTAPDPVAGTFVSTKSSTAVAYCGTFTGTDDGTFNFAIEGTTLVGTATSTTGSVTPLDGTVSGTNITITNPGAPSGPPLAVGTISGTDVSGTFDDGAGSSGTWTGSK